ncbi:23S rRNA (adenine(2503)-C(2))-methyltransferase RlmN [bacterium]|nr:MAG: 23S rRNA (adenine(2503)-C(2))-methyltransferase RlmN [bacterium]
MQRDAMQIWWDDRARALGLRDGQALADELGLKRYRVGQLYHAAVKELAGEIDAITVLPQTLRDELHARAFPFDTVAPNVVQRSSDAQTTKGLFALRDGQEIEAVLMEHHGDRNTVCVSSQAGCAFACAFCATGQAGFSRHLSSSEIFDQARYFARTLAAQGRKVTNVVFMGMGEPFHNYDAVLGAVALLNDPKGFGLGHRHITISTVGVVPMIDRFAGEGLQVNLAISLHAPTDEQRGAIMPVNKRWAIGELMGACARYVEQTGRKIFFEYLMLAGVNDRVEDARELARLMAGRLYHVNLIPYNSTPDAEFQGSEGAIVDAFQRVLTAAGVPSTIRHPMGRDIAAACGQLRAQTQPRAGASV